MADELDMELEAQLDMEREMQDEEFEHAMTAAAELAERQLGLAPANAEPAPMPPPPAGKPKTDLDAIQRLHSLCGHNWMSFGAKTLFVYNDGIWSAESVKGVCPSFHALVFQHMERLGNKYGKSLHGIQTLQKLALGMNRCANKMTEAFDQLHPLASFLSATASTTSNGARCARSRTTTCSRASLTSRRPSLMRTWKPSMRTSSAS